MKRAQWVRGVMILVAAALSAGAPLCVLAQGWKPERPVEIVVGCAPGCGRPARAAQVPPGVWLAAAGRPWCCLFFSPRSVELAGRTQGQQQRAVDLGQAQKQALAAFAYF